jgi:copper transport protein
VTAGPANRVPGPVGSRRRGGASVLAGACLALLLALAPTSASAHATIISSTPQPGQTLRTSPGVIVLTFSQAIDIRLSRAAVVTPDGRRFPQGSVSPSEIRIPLTDNTPGVYRVSWTSVSAVDGHTLSGDFRFGVNVSPAAGGDDAAIVTTGDVALAGARAVEDALLLLAVGLLLLLELAGRAPRIAWTRTRLPIVLAATALAGLAVTLGEALVATGGPASDGVIRYLTAGPSGWTRLARVSAEAVALLVCLLVPRRWRRLTALPLAGALAALAASGHAAAVQPVPLGVAVTVVHLASAGLWAGGILALALQRPPGGWLGRESRTLLARFSPVALAAFPVTIATGVLQGAEELSGLRDLVASTYGEVLALKSLAVLLMLPLSFLAWRRLLPTPRLEAVLALVVVGASALLAAFPLPPARLREAQAAQAGPAAALALPSGGDLTMASTAGDVLVGLTLRPGRPGRNTAWLYVLPIGGEPAASRLSVTLASKGRPAAVRRCGPACRASDVDVGGGETLSVGVDGQGGGTAAFRVPSLPAPDASALVDQAQQVMHALHTYRLDETLRPARAPLQVTYAFQAPDRLSYQVSGGSDSVIIGPTEYSRDGPGAQWHAETLPPVQVPSFVWDGASVVAPRSVGTTQENGQALRSVSFYEDLDGTPVWFDLEIDAEGHVDRAAMRAQAHFMDHRYHDFDTPLTVVPPP